MSTTTISRLSGLALISGGLLFALGNLLHPLDHSLASQTAPTWALAHLTFVVGGIVMLLGLPTVHAYQAGRAGVFGLISYALLTVGIVGLVPSGYFEAYVVPAVGSAGQAAVEQGAGGTFSAILGMVYLFGSLLFGFVTFRARVFPRPAALLIVLAAVGMALLGALPGKLGGAMIIAGTVLWGLAFAWIGVAYLASTRAASNTAPAPVESAALLRRAS